MKTFLLLSVLISLLSIATYAQPPAPSASPVPNTADTQLSPSLTPSPAAASNDRLNLNHTVALLASIVMLSSVIAMLALVWRLQETKGRTVGTRHIQFVSVCLIVPTVLILGLEEVLSKETTATLIGGLTGALLSNLSRNILPNGGGRGGDSQPPPESKQDPDKSPAVESNETCPQ